MGTVVLMFRIDAFLARLVAVLIPLFCLLLRFGGRRLRPLTSELRLAYAGSVAIVEENIAMPPVIKSFTHEANESERHRRQIHHVREPLNKAALA